MDAREFLASVLPWDNDGYATVHWHRKGDDFLGRSCQSIDDAMKVVAALMATTQSNIYFCLSRQRLNAGKRSRVNALAVQALWFDIDVDPKDSNKYSTLAEAIAAVLRFCQATSIPYPSWSVGSGGGLHTYWLSDRPFTVEEWQPYADALKITAKNANLKIDAGLTGDVARVLRVPGTTNWNYDPPRKVLLLDQYSTSERHDFSAVFAKLLNVVPVGALGPVAIPFKQLDPKDNLGAGIGHDLPPMPFAPIKDGCAWLREAHETGGRDFDEPQWHLTTLIATFLENGHELAHQFGNQHPEYSVQSTEAKWDSKIRSRRNPNIGWPQCRIISNHADRHCRSCPQFKKDKSPLNLGLEALAHPEAEDLGGIRPEGFSFPQGFCLNEAGRICAIVLGKKLTEPPRLLQLLFNRITSPSLQCHQGTFGIAFIASTDLGGTQEVFLSASNCYAPGLFSTLSGKSVLYNPDKTARSYMEKLAASWLDKLMNERTATRDPGTLGWRYDDGKRSGFAYGGNLYCLNGSIIPVVSGGDDEFRKWYMPTGTKDVWLRACKLLTDRKRPELDCLIAIGFAAPLMIFTGTLYGAILSVWGEPGTSKSTAQQIAAAVWGHPKQTRESLNSTPKSVQGRLGRTKNLAAFWDDIQDERHQEFLFQTLFVATEGAEGGRLNPDASYKTRLEWHTLLTACSNASFVEFLIKKQKSTTAGMRRVFEIQYNRNPNEPGMIDGLDANKAFAELEHNYGAMGIEYVKLLASKHDQIEQLVDKITKDFKATVGGTADESYWWGTCGVLLSGAILARRLGADLDVAAMGAFLTQAFYKNRAVRRSEGTEGGSFANTEQSLTAFLNFYVGSGNFLYTDVIFGSKMSSVHIIRYPMPGRPVYIQVARDERKVLISKKQFREYLQDNGIHARQVLEGLAKYYRAREVKMTIGAGTGFGVATELCLELLIPEGQQHGLESILTAHGQAQA